MLTSFAGSRLFGQAYGSARPSVLALHGWRRDGRDFASTLSGPPPLDAIALDLPGFGGTPEPPSGWGSPEYARALLPLLEEMAPSVLLVGHSFGGRVAVQLATIAPDRVAGMVLSGAPLFRPGGATRRPAMGYRVVRRLAQSGLVSEERLERARQRHGSADYRVATGVMREVFVRLMAEDYEHELGRIACPVELVWGDDDTEAPLEVAERIRDAVTAPVRLTVVKGAGHLTPLTIPGTLREAVDRLRS